MRHGSKPGRSFAAALLISTVFLTTVPAAIPEAIPEAAASEATVPAEDALWAAAGEAFSHGIDKSAAMQQYRLFVQTYDDSPRAARAQFMLGECYFAVADHEGALREYDLVEKFKGRDDYLRASVLLRQGECFYNLGHFDDAIACYTRLIDKYDDTFLLAEALYEVGLTYIVQSNWLKLRSAYRELLESRPGYRELPQVKFALGLFAYQEERYEEAVEYFAQVPSDRGLYYLGRCLEDTGQYILAIQRYKQMLRQYPESSLGDDAAFSIAEAFYRSGQNSVAVRSYESFIESYPDSPFVPNGRYKIACVTYREGRYDESIRQLTTICDQFGGELVGAYAQYLIGDGYLQLGRTAEAIFAYTEVVRSHAESPVASAALHKVVYGYAAENNHGQAILLADEFGKRYPGDPLSPRVQVLAGFSHLELEQYDDAIQIFQNVLDKHVNSEVAERALFLSTLAYTEQGELDRLITNYKYLASKLLPTPSDWRARTYYYLGEAYYHLGLHREAGGMYRLVLTGYPRSNVAAASLQGLVASLSQMGQYELALQEQETYLLTLANADSDEGTNSLAVGSIYFNQHEYDEALRQFSSYLAKHPDAPEAAVALANQADCYYRLQYYEQALESWGVLLSRFPDSGSAPTALYRMADTQFGLGQFAAARQSYRRLLSTYPDENRAADAAYGLASCAYNLGEFEAAIAAFDFFIASYPEDERVADASTGIQSCYYRGGKDMHEYLAQNPDSPLTADIYWNQGQEAFNAGDFTAAARHFEKVTLDYPGSESGPGALFYLAESYYRLESQAQALAGYRNFIGTHSQHDLVELARFREATVLFKLQRFDEAATAYEFLADHFSDGEYGALACYNAAVCYEENEDWTAAIGGYVRFLADFPHHENG
ncbi:MAG: tetratricopeptide repeat protein, partial [bacterium]